MAFNLFGWLMNQTPAVADIWSVLLDKYDLQKPSDKSLADAYKNSSAVNACINEITRAVSSAQINAPVVAQTLLQNPNNQQSWDEFSQQLLISYLTVGYAIVYKQNSTTLRVLAPEHCNIHYGAFGAIDRIDYNDANIDIKNISPKNYILFTSPSSTGLPCSPVMACWSDVLADTSRSAYQVSVLQRLPNVFLTAEIESGKPCTKEQRDELSSSLKSKLGGGVVVPPAGVKLQTLGLTDIGLDTVAAQCESRIAACFNVPAILVGLKVGLDRSTYSNYEEARQSLYDETVDPILKMLSRGFTKGLGVQVEIVMPETTNEPTAQEQPNDTNSN